ncbi:MAG TPA: lysine-2,3-aminomutase-like protein, partial [Candidatus Competibacteraceae bacterium]|nr:lysine-2,3-aminomutase-like protein [Candidatus Competibacteraceae bacterium]
MSTLHTLEQLASAGLIRDAQDPDLRQVAERYAVALSPAMAALIDRQDPADPIARQFLPDVRELQRRPEELADPIGDEAHSPVKGIVHRYADRVLLKLTEICPVYCRFCFRRELIGPDSGQGLSAQELEAALAYIARTPAIWEVILTGGDPLVLSPRRLGAVVAQLAAIEHVGVIRIHSRVPVVAPERITAELVAALKGSKPVYLLLHCNHPRELTEAARAACARLVEAGIVLLSQSVLLKGVNDDLPTLTALMRAFVANRIKPYYLHHPDLAPGTSHFRLDPQQGLRLLRELRRTTSGLCQPTYILEIPGGHGKVPLTPRLLEPCTDGGYLIEDLAGRQHRYRDAI